MRRKYNADQAMRAIELLRDAIPHVKFTTDVIVGFPGESEEDFNESCHFAEKAGFLMMHVFPYSKRKDTVAAEMHCQITEDVKRERVHKLTDISKKIRNEILDRAVEDGRELEVLFETCTDGYAQGHTADFIEVRVKTDRQLHGAFRSVKLISHDSDVCEGVFANEVE
jgi:threonylcarbamoyladenosine tRNA methylthiotransferase MtaB